MIKLYRQCRYEALDGSAWDESWLPLNLAHVGQIIYFGDITKRFRVTSTGARVRTAQDLNDQETASRKFGPSIP